MNHARLRAISTAAFQTALGYGTDLAFRRGSSRRECVPNGMSELNERPRTVAFRSRRRSYDRTSIFKIWTSEILSQLSNVVGSVRFSFSRDARRLLFVFRVSVPSRSCLRRDTGAVAVVNGRLNALSTYPSSLSVSSIWILTR